MAWPVRYKMIALLFCGSVINYVDRVNISVVTAGQIVAYPLTTWVISQSSWQTVFYINALFGFVWMAIWWWYAADTPAAHPAVSPAERDYIAAHLPPRSTTQIPLRVIVT